MKLRTFALEWFQVIVWSVWAIVVAGGLAIIATSGEPRVYLAAKPLPANHRLIEGDLAEAGWPYRFLVPGWRTRAAFVGRYLIRRIPSEGEVIEFGATSGAPSFPVNRSVLGWFSLAGLPVADVAGLDPGHRIEICNLTKGQCGDLLVEAVVCGATAGDCWAGIRLSNAQRDRLIAATTTKSPKPAIVVFTHGAGKHP